MNAGPGNYENCIIYSSVSCMEDNGTTTEFIDLGV